MFTKILIANRGEIACRVAATARRMGIQTVAVYADADAHSLHVQACDVSVHIGPAAASASYLRPELILAAARATGAQAIHPGYGFLSENAEFAWACEAAGLVFIGPPAAAIRAMGLKAESKRLMGLAGVPLVPGYHGDDQTLQRLQLEADGMGYPVLIKASAGGGGKGMRIVSTAAEFPAALAACQREALHSFGNEAVLIERYLTRPRHIEIQVFADTHGHGVYLFERDCSVQRRHQKVLEEAPAPGLSPERRLAMGNTALAAARAVGYVGAGTVEFIAEPDAQGDLQFYFMEMNTRLQVEHPVTEAITGLDLVEWQLRVAAGQPLPLMQNEIRCHGHAIEARICAENPEAQFLPATGLLHVFRTPPAVCFEGSTVLPRLDTGVRQGDAITPHYDSMMAKLIVWGVDRAQALARMDAALAQTHIAGVHTNVAFLRRVVNSPSYAQAQLDTALITREAACLFHPPPLAPEQAVAAALACVLAQEQAQVSDDPWAQGDGWRLHGAAVRGFTWCIDGQPCSVQLEQARGVCTLVIGPQRWHLSTRCLGGAQHEFTLNQQRGTASVYATPSGWSVHTHESHARIETVQDLLQVDPAEPGRLTAPMPGKLLAFLVQAGDRVTSGQALAIIEAMKMEHTIVAPHAGTVTHCLYAVGDQLKEGDTLLAITAPEI